MPSEFLNNENRARLRDSINKPTPRSADGSIAGGSAIDPANSLHGNDLPPGILNPNSTPMTKDSHSGGRHRDENATVRAGEKSREKYAEEIRRRIHGPARDVKYR
jgi:hypothetical protein